MGQKPHRARKRFGQHFLVDQTVVQHIVAAINPSVQDHFVEIGPGLGALTTLLLPQAGRVDAVELDRDIVPRLRARCADLGTLIVHNVDALSFDYCGLEDRSGPLRVVGNLPYNISTALLFKLLEHIHCIRDMYFMLQKEVVERLTAVPNTSDYGRLSVMTQQYCHMQNILHVPPAAFDPPPKVDSAVVVMRPYDKPLLQIDDKQVFAQVVTRAFSNRRKTLRNNFKDTLDAGHWRQLDIDPQRRAETLQLEEFARLSNMVRTLSQPER